MTNAQTNRAFLTTTDRATRADIIGTIAAHYGCTAEAALEEVTQDEAEHLLDYLTGSTRSAVHVLMQRRGFSK